jgi:hypothetical protein
MPEGEVESSQAPSADIPRVDRAVEPSLATPARIAYPELVTAAHAVCEAHHQVEESLRAGFSNALTYAIEAGRKLAYAKSLVPHGGWGLWVEQNLVGIDARTERLYRQLAEAADAGRFQSGGALPVSSIRQARELIAAAASPPFNAAAGGGPGRAPGPVERDDSRPRQRHKGDPIGQLLDYGEPFALDEVEDLDAADLEVELAGQLQDRYPTHAADWAEWWAERFQEAGRRVR